MISNPEGLRNLQGYVFNNLLFKTYKYKHPAPSLFFVPLQYHFSGSGYKARNRMKRELRENRGLYPQL
jgi:hypothetical protein